MSVNGSAKNVIELRGSLSLPNAIIGKSAYDIAILNGFEGTEAEWLESLKGDPYTLTEADKTEIANMALDLMEQAEDMSV